MQRGTSRKFAVIALGLMTLALVVVGVVILFQIQNNQESGDAEAFGFGSSAQSVNFDEVAAALNATPCEFYLNRFNLSNTTSEVLNNYGKNITPLLPDERQGYSQDIPKNCVYSSSTFTKGDVALGMAISTYEENAVIDNSPQELYDRVNDKLLTGISGGPTELLNQVYFYGPSKASPDDCVAVLFHKQNDFEYAAITLFGQPCNESGEYIGQVVEQVANLVEFVMAPFLVEGFYDYEIPESAFTN